jgi:tripartite-type tricarboxylate transporter receptor subunit TctC
MKSIRRSALLAVSALLCCAVAGAEESADFKGKTVTIVVGFEASGAYDLYGRLFGRFLGAHLPGEPNVVVQNMPGAGGLVAANYLYNVAPRDGTALGVISQTAGIGQVLETPGVRYDVRKFVWVGRLVANSQVLHAWYTSGIKTMADAMTHEVIVAGTGPTSSSVVFPHIMNDLIGTKFKVVPGYNGPTSATLAMERGEVEAVVRPWDDIKSKNPDWLRDKKINLLVQFALAPDREIPDVPAVVDLAHDQGQRQLMALFASGNEVDNAIVAPPGLAAPVAAALRKAFDDMMKDQNFLDAAREAHLDLDLLSGDRLQAINDSTFAVPDSVVAEAKKYSAGN